MLGVEVKRSRVWWRRVEALLAIPLCVHARMFQPRTYISTARMRIIKQSLSSLVGKTESTTGKRGVGDHRRT